MIRPYTDILTQEKLEKLQDHYREGRSDYGARYCFCGTLPNTYIDNDALQTDKPFYTRCPNCGITLRNGTARTPDLASALWNIYCDQVRQFPGNSTLKYELFYHKEMNRSVFK